MCLPQQRLLEHRDNDFADLPGEEILIPSEQTPPSLNQNQPNQPKRAEPAKRDALEGLINQVT